MQQHVFAGTELLLLQCFLLSVCVCVCSRPDGRHRRRTSAPPSICNANRQNTCVRSRERARSGRLQRRRYSKATPPPPPSVPKHHQRPTFRSIYWKTRWRRAASAVWQVEEKAVVAGSNRSCCCCTQPPPPGMVYTVVDVQCYNGCVCSLESGWALAGERTHTPKQAATIPQQGRILKKIPGGKEGGGKRNPTKK